MGRLLNRWTLACAMLILFPSLLWAQRPTEFFGNREVAAREVLVKFRAPSAEKILEAALDEDVDEIEEVGGTGTIRFHSRRKDAVQLVNDLLARGDVEFAEPNYIVHAIVVPNDLDFGELWGLQNTGQPIRGSPGIPGADISAVPAWDISTGSRAQVVAVVDTGVDYSHPDLAANLWSAPAPFTVTIAGRVITCPAATPGFNAITNTCDPLDDHNHGSHVAGTIGAVGNDGRGVVGVNWAASIMALKFLDSNGTGTIAGAINAIEFAIQAKAAFASTGGANVRVLSNSWGGGGFSQALLDQINRANANDMLFVVAAGNSSSNNDTSPFYPASYNAPNMVAVAATDNTDALAWFSNYGSTSVHLGAPGVDVLSTVVGGAYAYFSGTSMATPHVSGAATLLLSRCSLTTAGLKSTMLGNVDPIPSLTGLTVTGGRLNAAEALSACSVPPTADFSLAAAPNSQTVAAGVSTSYTVTVTPSGGFAGTVTFSASGLPAGAGASFTPPSITTSGSATMTVTTSSAATPPGTYSLTITGTSGSNPSRSTTVTLVVQAPPSSSTTVTFDNPVPPGSSFSLLNGEFQGIDFGTGQWRWESAYNVDPTNHIFFDSPSGTLRTFRFSPVPRILTSLRVFTTGAGTLTLSDDRGQTVTRPVATGSLQLVTTGWAQTSTVITVTFTAGWNLGIDDITYSGAGGADTTPPTVTITSPTSDTTYSTGSSPLALGGTAGDNVGVTQVTWANDRGGSGVASGTTNWSVSGIVLQPGPNVLTVTARDAAGTPGTDTLTVTYTPPAGGLVAAYSFNAGAGTTVADGSGNGNTGVISGATWTTLGRFGGALAFDGVNDWVTVPDAASLDLTTGLTLAAWVYPTVSPTAWRTVVAKEGTGTVVAYYLHASSLPADQPATGVRIGGVEQQLKGGARLAANVWTHLAATYDGATLRLYVNGVQVASRAQTGAIVATTNPLRIGGNGLWGEYFQGRIDEVRLYNRARSQAEIQSDMSTPLSP